MSKTRIILVRHGETEYNKAGCYLGDLDVPLSDIGKQQAIAMAEALSTWSISAVISSPLIRAQHTATAISNAVKRPVRAGTALRVSMTLASCGCVVPCGHVQLDTNLREMSFGSWEGKTSKEVDELHPDDLKKWNVRAPSTGTGPTSGETFESVALRVGTSLDSLANKYPNKTIVVVSHVYAIKAALDIAMQLPQGYHANRLFLDTGTANIIDWSVLPDKRIVRRVNWAPTLNQGIERWSKMD